MSTSLAVKETIGEAVERVLIAGDLAKLSAEERVSYYKSVCESVGLNPLTRPLEYITLNGKLTLYARKDATDQLRANNQVSIAIVAREVVEGCYVVTAQAKLPSGRTDESIGAVPIDKLVGEARSNALMKCETKAKRRVTLSICGMGLLDESEVDSIPGAKFGETSVKVTTEAKTFGKPKESPVRGGPAASGESLSNLAEGQNDSKATPILQTLPPLADLVEAASGKSPLESSTLEQQTAFAMKFREALPEKFRPHADQLRRTALAESGYTDIDGNGTSKVIPRKDFPAIAKKLIAVAAKMTDPFIPNDDDLPGNI